MECTGVQKTTKEMGKVAATFTFCKEKSFLYGNLF